MTAIVYASTGGQKYHFNQKCPAFKNAQELNDLDCGCDTYCTHRLPRMHGLQRMSATKAAMEGKLPCLACVPQHLREMPETENFGHEPITGISLFDLAETVCRRCTLSGAFYSRRNDEYSLVHIPWPCTSAIVLGIVPRLGAAR